MDIVPLYDFENDINIKIFLLKTIIIFKSVIEATKALRVLYQNPFSYIGPV